MPVRSEYDEELAVWRIRSEGPLTVDETVRVLGGIYDAVDPTRPLLILWETAGGPGVMDSSDLQKLMAFIEKKRPEVGGRTAIVAHDEVTYGMGRVAQIYGESIAPHLWVFRKRDEALAWLLEAAEGGPGEERP